VLNKHEEAEKETAGLEGDERWELARRIASSRTFAKSLQLQAFLLYVTRQAIAGRFDEIKEQAIGSQVLGRKADYDPAGDNIVRVRARQLRKKIEQYFSGDGENEKLILKMPTGSYVPVFEKHIPESAATLPEAKAVDVRPLWKTWLPLALTCAFALLSLTLWFRFQSLSARSQSEVISRSLQQFWGQVFSKKGDEVLLVLGDSGFALWQDLMHRNLTLADYLSAGFRQPAGQTHSDLAQVASRRYTSLADVNFVTRFLPLSQKFGARVKVRLARNIDIHDLKTGNVVFLGSRRANPWVEIFEPHIHYAYDYNVEAHRSFFRNTAPRPGEPEILARNNNGASKGESYGLVALLPNMSGTGKVLLIEGLNMEGTDGAGEFLLNPETCAILNQRLRSEIGLPGQHFEALLKLTPVAGGSANVQLVSVRRPLPPGHFYPGSERAKDIPSRSIHGSSVNAK
jgi:hypothetical protein